MTLRKQSLSGRRGKAVKYGSEQEKKREIGKGINEE